MRSQTVTTAVGFCNCWSFVHGYASIPSLSAKDRPVIRLKTFGTCQLESADGGRVTVVEMQPSAMAVLAYLAIARPLGRRRRDELVGIFWPDLDDNHARTALRKALHRIRSSVGENVVLAYGADCLELSADNFQCDTNHFQTALEAGRLQECIGWYRGELLPGFYGSESDIFERWLTIEREFYKRQAASAALRLVDFYETNHEFTNATQMARIVARLACTDERILRRVLTMLDRLGDRAGAAEVYRRFSDDLWREFAIRPSAETVALMESIALRTA